MVVTRISKTTLLVGSELVFLREDGLYGTDKQRKNYQMQIIDFLVSEVYSDEGRYIQLMNSLLEENKIKGSLKLCLEL